MNGPIRAIDFADPADVARHDRMVALVTQMLDLHARLAAEGVPHEKAALQRRVAMTDRLIDRLVYELYGLTDEEIGVVVGSWTCQILWLAVSTKGWRICPWLPSRRLTRIALTTRCA